MHGEGAKEGGGNVEGYEGEAGEGEGDRESGKRYGERRGQRGVEREIPRDCDWLASITKMVLNE